MSSFVKSFTANAAKAAHGVSDSLHLHTPRSERAKFRARGKGESGAKETPRGSPTAATDPTATGDDTVKLLVQPAESESVSFQVPTADDAGAKVVAPNPALPSIELPNFDPSMRLPEDERIKRYMDAAATVADSHHGGCATCLRTSAPVVTVLVRVIAFVAPLYLYLFRKAYWFYTWAPKNVLQMAFGAALCFFGGTYVAAIAAIEAWRQMGWQRSWADVMVVYSQMRRVYDASNEDDLVDADKDGIADVNQITPHELAQRKLRLAMVTVAEPDKLQTAVGSLWAAYLAVLATLRLEFARVAALALGIAEMVKFPVVRVASPPLAGLLGPELKHWVPTLLTTTINVVAISFAWYLQKIISAFYSGLRGGRMFADALFAFLDDFGWLEKLPFVKQPFDHNESYLDEAVGYGLAGLGFFTQFYYGFSLAFPLNLIFLPLTIVEWVLEYQIVMGAPGQGAAGG